MLAPHSVPLSNGLAKPRTVRAATQRRIVRKSRARYAGITRVMSVLIGVLFLLMLYVVLTSNLTGLSYAVATANARREALLEETMRLDDRIATLRSDDRLASLASRMGMREPQLFAVVRLRSPHREDDRPRFAMFSSLAGLFAPVVNRQP